MAEKRRFNLSLSLDNPLQRKAWEVISGSVTPNGSGQTPSAGLCAGLTANAVSRNVHGKFCGRSFRMSALFLLRVRAKRGNLRKSPWTARFPTFFPHYRAVASTYKRRMNLRHVVKGSLWGIWTSDHIIGSPKRFIQALFVRCPPRHPKAKSACPLGVVLDTLIFAGFRAEPVDNVVRRLVCF